MRTKEEIQRQVEGLTQMKTWLPEYSAFGDPNHKVIDAQISILKSISKLSDYEFEEYDEFDDNLEAIFRGAEEAEMWLDGDTNEDLFEER